MVKDNNQASPNQRPCRESVLIVVRGDGYIEVFAHRHVDVHIVQTPVTHSQMGERLADLDLDETLPFKYRQIFFPYFLRAAELIRPISADEFAQARYEKKLFREIRTLEKIIKEGQRCQK